MHLEIVFEKHYDDTVMYFKYTALSCQLHHGVLFELHLFVVEHVKLLLIQIKRRSNVYP